MGREKTSMSWFEVHIETLTLQYCGLLNKKGFLAMFFVTAGDFNARS
jgi:hypothetical protein